MNNIFIDIESIPSQSAEYASIVKAGITPPATYKKQESIEKWLEENRDDAAREAIAKTSFNPAMGHICTIGFAIDNEPAIALHADDVRLEGEILAEFFNCLPKINQNRFIGHYISGFDMRFILCRSMALGVKLPHSITFPRNPKPWPEEIFVTMVAWAGQKDKISLVNLCNALGIAGKSGYDGSMVTDAWANGEHEKIANYCKSDIELVRAVYRKFEAVGF